MKFLVYQRRMMVEAMQTQAMAVSIVNPEKAQKAIENYLKVALPVDPEVVAARERANERRVESLASAAPIPFSSIRF